MCLYHLLIKSSEDRRIRKVRKRAVDASKVARCSSVSRRELGGTSTRPTQPINALNAATTTSVGSTRRLLADAMKFFARSDRIVPRHTPRPPPASMMTGRVCCTGTAVPVLDLLRRRRPTPQAGAEERAASMACASRTPGRARGWAPRRHTARARFRSPRVGMRDDAAATGVRQRAAAGPGHRQAAASEMRGRDTARAGDATQAEAEL